MHASQLLRCWSWEWERVAACAGVASMLVMTMPAQGAHELAEVAHATMSGCAERAVEEQAATVRAPPTCSMLLLCVCVCVCVCVFL